jgi:DNA-binding LacI/PurR family transcriptional regulator
MPKKAIKAKKHTHGWRPAKHWSLDLVRDDAEAPSLYVQVREGIRRHILEGKLSAGDTLMPQRELCKNLGVNQVTLTKAIADLLNDGLLRSEHGRGIFISKVTPPVVGIIYYGSHRALDKNPFYGRIARAAVEVLGAASMRVELITREHHAPELRFGPSLSDVLGADVDGYLSIGVQNDEYLAALMQSDRPLVAVDATPLQANINAVVSDSFREGYLATRHLLENGHRRIIFIGGDRGVHPADPSRAIRVPEPDSAKRLGGFLLALAEAGIGRALEHVFERLPAEGTSDETTLTRMVHSGEATAAIVMGSASGDWLATRVKVPAEFSLMCFAAFDDNAPQWSSCHSDAAEMGRAAAKRLITLLKSKPDGEPATLITITPSLLKGRSVKRVGGPPAYYRYLQGQLDSDSERKPPIAR